MALILPYIAISVLICPFTPTTAFPQSRLDLKGSRTRRDNLCRNDEYLDNNICCLKCTAGKYVTSTCSRRGEKPNCEECEDGTFIEHDNQLTKCFKCTRCRSDQEIVRQCTHTQDTECQCKAGRFCAPDQACEVCHKCSRCDQDQVMVRNCTATSNTVCKKNTPSSGSASATTTIVAVLVTLAAAAVIFGILVYQWKKKQRGTDSQGDGLKAEEVYTEDRRNSQNRRPSCSNQILSRQLVRVQHSSATTEECKELCESLDSSASNSQQSLTILSATPPQDCAMFSRQPNKREDEPFPKLVPLMGHESLRKCFEYFCDMDVSFYKRFFRHLYIHDNVIKSKESLPYEDRIHELLNIWVEREGRNASLNDLLKELLDLNQRRTAETIMENAVKNGHYIYEDE